MNSKQKAKIRLVICSIPFVVFLINALLQIPVCMHYDYPMSMLGIEAHNWFDAWTFNVGLYLICSLFIFIPCSILIIYSAYILLKHN